MSASSMTSYATSVAIEWLNPMVSWLGSWFQSGPNVGGRSEATRIAESLLFEIVTQGRLLEQQSREKQQVTSGNSNIVDYSWLITEKPKPYDIPDSERLDLEEVCRQVTPESYSRVIREFRSALLRDPLPSDLPAIMRAVIRRVIDEQRSAEATDSSPSAIVGGISRWISDSMTNMRSRLGGSSLSVVASDDMELSASMSSAELGNVDNDLNV